MLVAFSGHAKQKREELHGAHRCAAITGFACFHGASAPVRSQRRPGREKSRRKPFEDRAAPALLLDFFRLLRPEVSEGRLLLTSASRQLHPRPFSGVSYVHSDAADGMMRCYG